MCVSYSVSDSVTPWSLPGSSVHRILQARIMEWVALPFFRGIFLTLRWNLGLLHCRRILYHLSHQGTPIMKTSPPKSTSPGGLPVSPAVNSPFTAPRWKHYPCKHYHLGKHHGLCADLPTCDLSCALPCFLVVLFTPRVSALTAGTLVRCCVTGAHHSASHMVEAQ